MNRPRTSVGRRLGCLNTTGVIAVGVVVLLVLGIELLRGGVLFSPGSLNAQAGQLVLGGVRSHADLAGRCSACHPPFWSQETMAVLCQNCHTDLTKNPKSFHSLMVSEGRMSGCQTCHPDHNGPSASLIQIDLINFPHNTFGFSLQGHQRRQDGSAFSCSDCHNGDYRKVDQQVCITCHTRLDIAFMTSHQSAYGNACFDCHDGVDRFGKPFDHSKFNFTLVGKHSLARCEQCHQGALKLADFSSASPDCLGCHTKDDIHTGNLGKNCGSCHQPAGWSGATFDHSKALFPLSGKHASVPCNQCHGPGSDGKVIYTGTPQTCYACHAKDDHHQGQFGQDCGACHSPVDWTQATFDHSKSAFPLTGAHLKVDCNACHKPGSTGAIVFAGLSTVCVSCHSEPAYHQGLFGTVCETCHNTSAWSPASFTGAHPFPISHGGANTCHACHPTTLRTYTCYTCHNQGQIVSKHREEGITNLNNCIRCHPTGQGDG